MDGKDKQAIEAAALRQRAEKTAREKAAGSPQGIESLGSEEIGRMFHELEVHQIELEMQNEELHRAQAELDASRARYFDLYDLAPVGYVTVSEKGLILEANLTAATLLGVTRGDLVKRPLSNFILAEDQDIYLRHRRLLFETGAPQTCELRMGGKTSAPFWARLDAATTRDREGAAACHCAMIDISVQKNAQAAQEKLQEKLAQARKMEAVGRLAGGVAHNLNNMLGVILGYGELALEKVAHDDPLHADLADIITAARRSADITRQLLAFARKQTVVPKVLDLNETVEGMLRMLRRLIGEDIHISWQPGAGLWPVKIDPSQIDQILANLCVNARDAIGGVGKLSIETQNVCLDREYGADHPGFVPGEYVLLAVSDNGRGMDTETLDNLFEPFFTTKGVGEGAGLGLATVYGIVRQNEGFIDVHSEPGQGTTFKFYLPRHVGEVARADTRERPAKFPMGRGETMLMVEDEAAVLKLGRKLLEGLGYGVLTANNPDEAMALAEERAGEIGLLITDVVMPTMSGGDLAKRLKARCPRLKVLFMSGYTANVIAHHGVLEEGIHFLQKPFSRGELADRVREALG